jgi:hypothetical protein
LSVCVSAKGTDRASGVLHDSFERILDCISCSEALKFEAASSGEILTFGAPWPSAKVNVVFEEDGPNWLRTRPSMLPVITLF